MSPHYLDQLFTPRAIAVFGAADNPQSVGARVFQNLRIAGFTNPIYPINPKHTEVQGARCFATLADVGHPVDLAVIATPAATVPDLIRACGQHGTRAAIVISAGFSEVEGGAARERELLETAHSHGVRIVGPNCLGLINPYANLNATFSNNTAKPGTLALVSQSGALCTSILDWADARGIGFSRVVSLGAAADIDFGDLLDYLALDPDTQGILLYVEGVRHARRFMSGLRAAARLKPVVVVKVGRNVQGSRAALSHTGALVGADDVFNAALARAGVVRARSVGQLFAAAQLLATHHRVQGSRLAVVTNGGGPGVMAADRAADLGVDLVALEPETRAKLTAALPPAWSHGNPVDILGDAPPARFGIAVTACLADETVDGVLVMFAPQAMSEPLASAEAVIAARGACEKPVLACWMGETQVRAARERLLSARIPVFPSPESSVEAFSYLANHRRNQQLLLQTPAPLARASEADVDGARAIIERALSERRDTLTTAEAHALLAAFRIPVKRVIEARAASDAIVAAHSLGFPVVLKINAPKLSHKTDVDGVRLNLADVQAVRTAYDNLLATVHARRPDVEIAGVTVERMYQNPHGRELLVGIIRDSIFGPVITFGAGGTQVEAQRDRAVALPPLNTFLAQGLIEQTRVASVLGAFRNLPPVHMENLIQVLRRVSEMACEIPEIRELDINPLMADEAGAVALDARVFIERRPAGGSRYEHMAIHPYPAHLVTPWQLADGTHVVIRPIRPEDAEMVREFITRLSPRSRYFRFMHTLRELTQDMLVRFTQIDYDCEMAFVAVTLCDGRDVELGVARYVTNPDNVSAEFALAIADEWHGKGIGSRLMQALLTTARERGLKRIVGEVLSNNLAMIKLTRNLGFEVTMHPQDAKIRHVVKEL